MMEDEGEPPPPSYAEVTDTRCTFIDFTPKNLQQAGGIIYSAAMPAYETFDVLFEKANTWLKSNPQWMVISCESLESKLKYGSTVDTNKSTYGVDGKFETNYNRSLRLWICNKTPADNPEPQQLRYINLVPKCTDSSGAPLIKPEFENFTNTIERFNQQIANQPIQGRIINMETQNIKFNKWKGTVNVEACVWRESGKYNVYFLNIVRIFLEIGDGYTNRIGAMDFTPSVVGQRIQRFKETMDRANIWMSQQPPEVSICNVQSVDYKVKSGGHVDTKRSCYCEQGKWNTSFMRIIRVYWSQGSNLPRQLPLQVTYRTFMPGQITQNSFSLGQYETQRETSKRLLAWINATGAKVMSCETVKIRALDGYQNGNPEVVYVSDSGSFTKHFILGLRLYLDGEYADPPPGVLPPKPQIRNDDECCTIL